MPGSIADMVVEFSKARLLETLDESSTKQGVVLRLLGLLGWDVFRLSEVIPEFAVGNRRVDYALRIDSMNKVFIEVKRPKEDLANHQQQLLDYCFSQGVKLAVLTNGRTWRCYLPLREGSWEQRRFLTVDLEAQDPSVVETRFIEFLSRERVRSGDAAAAAERLVSSQQRADTIRRTMGQAWNDMVGEPDDLLVDIIAEATERLSGFKPDSDAVEAFLAEHLQIFRPNIAGGAPAMRPIVPVPSTTSRDQPPTVAGSSKHGFTGTKPTAFVLLRETRAVEKWIDVLIQVCEILYERNRADFPRVLEIRGRDRPYFSKDGSELRKPTRLSFVPLFVETNLSSNQIVRISNRLVLHFSYPPTELSIQIR